MKLILLQLLQSKTEQIELRGVTHKTRVTHTKKKQKKKKIKKINELQLIGETHFLYYNRRFNIVIFIYQNIEEKPANFSFEFFLR